MLKKNEYETALKILDQLLKKYDIPNEKATDGIAKIDGLTVEEYFKKIGIFNNNIYTKENLYNINMPTYNLKDISEKDYEENMDFDTFSLAS